MLVGDGNEQSRYEFPSVDSEDTVLEGIEPVRTVGCMPDMLSIEAQLQPPPSQLQGNDSGLSKCKLASLLSGVILSK